MTTTRQFLVAALAAAGVLMIAGCGGRTDAAATDPPGDQAQGRAGSLLIQADDLPDGWRDSNVDEGAFRTTICGVDLEPVEPLAGSHVRFSQGPFGPFLEQHVRVYADAGQPAAVAADLAAAVESCGTYTAKGTRPDSPAEVVKVRPLTVSGLPAGSAAFRQTAQGGDRLTNDMVFVPRGDALVAFVSYAVKGTPDAKVLDAALSALPNGD